MSKTNQHWTAESAEAFVHKLAFDFIAQLEEKIEASGLSQSELAKRLGVSKGSVSQVLNNPQNLTLKTIARYAHALGIKAAIVAYDDHDPKNEQGLVGSAIFKSCWEQLGCPRDVWSLHSAQSAIKATSDVVMMGGGAAPHGSIGRGRPRNVTADAAVVTPQHSVPGRKKQA